jgi:hypothetical protein
MPAGTARVRVGSEVADVFDFGGFAQSLHVVGEQLSLALVAQELLDRRRRLLEVTGCEREAARLITWAPFGRTLKIAWPSFIFANWSTLASGSCSAARTASLPAKRMLFAFR